FAGRQGTQGQRGEIEPGAKDESAQRIGPGRRAAAAQQQQVAYPVKAGKMEQRAHATLRIQPRAELPLADVEQVDPAAELSMRERCGVGTFEQQGFGGRERVHGRESLGQSLPCASGSRWRARRVIGAFHGCAALTQVLTFSGYQTPCPIPFYPTNPLLLQSHRRRPPFRPLLRGTGSSRNVRRRIPRAMATGKRTDVASTSEPSRQQSSSCSGAVAEGDISMNTSDSTSG